MCLFVFTNRHFLSPMHRTTYLRAVVERYFRDRLSGWTGAQVGLYRHQHKQGLKKRTQVCFYSPNYSELDLLNLVYKHYDRLPKALRGPAKNTTSASQNSLPPYFTKTYGPITQASIT